MSAIGRSDLLPLSLVWVGGPFARVGPVNLSSTRTLSLAYLGGPYVAAEGVITEAGSLAEATDEAFAGTGIVIAPGALASETADGLAGTGVVFEGGALGEVVDDGLDGTGLVVGTGDLASDVADALAGTGLLVGTGDLASELDDALTGTGLHVTPGGLGEVVDEALTGSGIWIEPGALGEASDEAFHGGGLLTDDGPEKGYLQLDGVDDYLHAEGAAAGVDSTGWTIIVKIADKPIAALQPGATRYVYSITDDSTRQIDITFLGPGDDNLSIRGTNLNGSLSYSGTPTDGVRGPLTISVFHKNDVTRRVDRHVHQGTTLLYSVTETLTGAADARTPLHLSAGARVLTGFPTAQFARLQIVSLVLLNGEGTEAEIAAYSSGSDARTVWTTPGKIHRYYAMGRLANGEVPDIGGDGSVPLALYGGLSASDLVPMAHAFDDAIVGTQHTITPGGLGVVVDEGLEGVAQVWSGGAWTATADVRIWCGTGRVPGWSGSGDVRPWCATGRRIQ